MQGQEYVSIKLLDFGGVTLYQPCVQLPWWNSPWVSSNTYPNLDEAMTNGRQYAAQHSNQTEVPVQPSAAEHPERPSKRARIQKTIYGLKRPTTASPIQRYGEIPSQDEIVHNYVNVAKFKHKTGYWYFARFRYHNKNYFGTRLHANPKNAALEHDAIARSLGIFKFNFDENGERSAYKTHSQKNIGDPAAAPDSPPFSPEVDESEEPDESDSAAAPDSPPFYPESDETSDSDESDEPDESDGSESESEEELLNMAVPGRSVDL